MAAPRTCEARQKTRALLVGGSRLTSSGSHQPLNQKHDGQRKHGTTDEKEKRFEKRRADSRLAPADAAARFGLDCGPFEFALEREHLSTPVDHAAWLPVGHDATKGLTR